MSNLKRNSPGAVLLFLIAACSTAGSTVLESVEPSIDTRATTRASKRLELDLAAVTCTPPADASTELIKPVPATEELLEELDVEFSAERARLGETLFHDTRLSTDNTLSCAACHDLRYGGVDRASTAMGIRGQVGPANTPTVFNAALSMAQFWDGRAANLVQQAGGPPLAAGEMGSSWDEILGKLRADSVLVEAFQRVYPDAIHSAADIRQEHVLESIAHFELTLTTPDSRFDRWLAGQADALTLEQRQGYEVFKVAGCVTCHYGPSAGGRTFQRLGAMRDFFTDEQRISHVDFGRYNVTNDERDKHVFKVPSLRNVVHTGPWFHDGSMSTLEDAVRAMGMHQLDLELSDEQVRLIISFLDSLTGEWRGRAVGAPRTDGTEQRDDEVGP